MIANWAGFGGAVAGAGARVKMNAAVGAVLGNPLTARARRGQRHTALAIRIGPLAVGEQGEASAALGAMVGELLDGGTGRGQRFVAFEAVVAGPQTVGQ